MLKSHFLYSQRESLSAQRRGATHGEGPGVLLPKPDHCRALNTKAEHILKVLSSPSTDTTREEELDWKRLNTHSDPPLSFVIFIYFFFFLPWHSKHRGNLCVHSHKTLGAQHLLQGQAFFFKQPQTTAVATFRQQDCPKAAHENNHSQYKKFQRIGGTQTSFVWKANKVLLILLQGK